MAGRSVSIRNWREAAVGCEPLLTSASFGAHLANKSPFFPLLPTHKRALIGAL